MITADFKPNKLLATNRSNAQHNDVKTRLVTAARSKSLHLSQMNLDVVLPEVFKLSQLTRLDLSFNNIVRLDPRINQLKTLQILWLNDNPLREVPIELSECHQLRELDLKNTFVISLPREMANLTSLLLLNLEGCPMKSSLTEKYTEGMVSIHSDLRRKEDRKKFKEQLFDYLTEWIYPSQPKDEVFERLEQIFAMLKDCNTDMLKKLIRNAQMLFPVKFDNIDPMTIRQRLFKLYDEGVDREQMAKLQLRLKSHFVDEPLESVQYLAAQIFHNIPEDKVVDQLFRYKSHIFIGPFAQLSAEQLLDNLDEYKKQCNQQRTQLIGGLKERIETLYIDDKLKPERLEHYVNELVRVLKFTSVIAAFTTDVPRFMPTYNELKHFNAEKIKGLYEEALAEEEAQRRESELKGPFNMMYNFSSK